MTTIINNPNEGGQGTSTGVVVGVLMAIFIVL